MCACAGAQHGAGTGHSMQCQGTQARQSPCLTSPLDVTPPALYQVSLRLQSMHTMIHTCITAVRLDDAGALSRGGPDLIHNMTKYHRQVVHTNSDHSSLRTLVHKFGNNSESFLYVSLLPSAHCVRGFWGVARTYVLYLAFLLARGPCTPMHRAE